MPEHSLTNARAFAASDLLEELKEYVGIVRRGWRLIALAMLICLTLSLVYLARTKRVYLATARLLVLQQGGRPLSVANNDPARLIEGAEDYLSTHSVVIR